MSKVLQPISKKEDVSNEEKFLQVEDVAHEEPQSESFLQEEKTLSEKEAEYKQKMGREESGKSDLEEERELKRVQVEDSLESFEKDRARVRQKRVRQNMAEVNRASKQQVEKVRNVQKTMQANKQVYANVNAAKAVMYQNDTLSNLISMAINDAIMNSGREAGYEEDHMSEKAGLTGRPKGRQKTILVNGAMVTLDEDVANAITAKRSPLLGKQSGPVLDGAAEGRAKSGSEIVLDDSSVLEKTVSDVEKDMNASKDALRFSEAELAYLDSEFSKLEQSLQSDRQEIDRAFVLYKLPYYRKYDYGVSIEGSNRKTRDLPEVSWLDISQEYLPNGRKLPYIERENNYLELSM